MKIAIPNSEALPAEVREAFDALGKQIIASWQVEHDAEGNRVREVFRAYHNTTQSLTTATWTALSFNSEDEFRDVTTLSVPSGVHSKSTRADRFIVPGRTVRYVRLRVRVVFASNATGDRGIRITKNETLLSNLVFIPTAASGVGATIITATHEDVFSPQETIVIEAYQNSGGNLNVGSTSRDSATEVQLEFL